jgi:hypothetical protein
MRYLSMNNQVFELFLKSLKVQKLQKPQKSLKKENQIFVGDSAWTNVT